jgi:tRNA pseudouridine(38-40) synthase
MQNLKLTIQYDGTNYHGWQVQANGRTVQGELTRVLSILDHRPVTLYGAGRTDAGGIMPRRKLQTSSLNDPLSPICYGMQ